MSGKKPVVLYGASGFSGRLVAEFLREFNVPFIAAGRDRARIQDVINHVPGIETAEYEIFETAGSVDDLVKLFTGARVVCNTVGPFLYHGPRVIEACLKAGCHYMDTRFTVPDFELCGRAVSFGARPAECNASSLSSYSWPQSRGFPEWRAGCLLALSPGIG